MDGTIERHHKVDLLRELAEICKTERVDIATKTMIDKYHALGKCVSYGRYLQAFGGRANLNSKLTEHLILNAQPEPCLF